MGRKHSGLRNRLVNRGGKFAAVVVLICVTALTLAQTGLAASTWTVTNGNDSGLGSLRDAIAIAAPGDTIVFDPSVTEIVLTTGLLSIDKDLSISGPGPSGITVNGNASSRIFFVNGGVTVSLSGLRLTNANGTSGGAITNFGALTVSNSLVDGNAASNGGGIWNGGNLTVTGTAIVGNRTISSTGAGGGIYNLGSVSIDQSAVSGNSANSGGGGGIWNSGTLTAEHSHISGNTTDTGSGGGVQSSHGTLTLRTSTISGNDVGQLAGGGIISRGDLTVVNSTISGNLSGRGGGIDHGSGTLTITNSTITENTADVFGGGGIVMFGGSGSFVNSIIAGNSGGPTASRYRPVCWVLSGLLTSLGNNVIGDTDGCGASFAPSDFLNTDPLLGPLQDNGGPTFTHELLGGSPAIDAGNDAEAPDTDQRGVTRPQGPQSDIGAFEVGVLVENNPPTAHAGASYSVECGVLVTLDGSASSDPDGDPLTFVWTDASSHIVGTSAIVSLALPVGEHTFTLTVTDDHGAASSDTLTVTVQDATAPVTSASFLSPDGNGDWHTTNVAVTLSASDSCSVVDGISFSINGDALTESPGDNTDVVLTMEGANTLQYFATDEVGNTESVRTLTVKIDKTPPTLIAPADMTVEATGLQTVVELGAATATDSVDPSPVITNNAPSAFPAGSTVVTWTATDAAGNSASATQTVTVSDTTAPTLTAPADVTVEAAGLQTVVELGAATATDSVDPDPTVTSDAPATFSLGSTVVTWTATDAAGNSASATQTVTVIPRPITVTAIPKSKTYGDPDPPLTYEITAGSLVAPDTIAGALSRAAGENVGAHAILQGTLTLGSSYALTYIGADLTINPRPATVTAGSGTKVYSDPDPLLLTTGAGFLPDDVAGIALLTIRVSGEAVGTYPTAATATGGQVGNYAVTYIAGTFTIQGAYVNKTNVLLEMQALRATVTEKEDGKKLDEAIERLEKSLDPKLWATPPDGVRLDPKDGEKVIELEKQAAEKLLQLIRSKKSALSDAVLQDWVDRMRMTSRLLATVAISDAVEADGDNKKIEEANKKLDEGDKKALENKGDAIEHYKTAWKQAQEALEKK